ncbi:sporulene cyclase [Melghirimyces thermohalophilus]|uniref:Sporulene cyclase n=1 Tax=Melghirimyces thermohalophilus TaxID=1236220 RepID=A0A1G6NX08_9BACL|nr:squalene--hopene cyclase [Melghirimyces thermohalophilus]SDC71874.1 sporulene cyclase [Melghirimyces thermohalophilus]
MVMGQHRDGVEREVDRLTRLLLSRQGGDGRWSFCFESGPMTDAYMILLYRLYGKEPEALQQMAERIRSIGNGDGTWKLFHDEKEGNLSATIESIVGLLYAGVVQPNDPIVNNARQFVRSRGGIHQAGSLTKVMLTLINHYDWSHHPGVPAEFLLLPWWFPINFFDFVGFTRVHVAPILLASNRRFSVDLPGPSLDFSDWMGEKASRSSAIKGMEDFQREIDLGLARLREREGLLKKRALQRGERFLLHRRETDGTLYSYFSTTFLMMFGLMGMGYSKNHPVLRQAMGGLESFLYPVKHGWHLQETTSNLWDTALTTYALQQAGCGPQHPAIRQGLGYLLQRQHTRLADWSLRNPGVPPGGWGFSDINTMNPDLDDTAAVLRAMAPSYRCHPAAWGGSWSRGVGWLLSMQNRDGGWSAFEKNTDKAWPRRLLPFDDAHTVWTDPSTNDLTSRCLAFVGTELGWKWNHPTVARAVRFLERNQEQEGCWFGRWGVTYIYGTWAALTGLAAAGIPRSYPAVQKGIQWLQSVQNEDGGWGESCRSDIERTYIPLKASTPSQTAWALDALITWHDQPTPEIEAGVGALLGMADKQDWRMRYPTGAGLAGQFYIHYHSYRYVWPLVALSHYRNKYVNHYKSHIL